MRFLITTVLLLSSVSAFALPDEGQFFWQAENGKTFLIPQLSYARGDLDLGPNRTADVSGFNLSLGAEHGLTEDISAGIKLAYTNLKSEITGSPSTTIKGLEDISFFLKGKVALSTGNFRYSAKLDLSPGKEKYDANGNANSYTGGHTLTPMIGYDMPVGSFTLGGQLTTELGLTNRKVDNAGTELKLSGRDETAFSIFGETACTTGHIGASLSFAKTSDSKNETTGVTATNSRTTKLDVYGDYSLNKELALTGDIGYGKFGSSDTFQDGKVIILTAGARYAF